LKLKGNLAFLCKAKRRKLIMEDYSNDKTFEEIWARKLRGAMLLRDYAIANNLFVPDDILKAVQDAEKKDIIRSDDPDARLNLDKAIRDLTSITFPTTIDTLLFQTGKVGIESINRLRRLITWIGILSLIIAIISYAFAKLDLSKNTILPGCAPVFKDIGLGFVGISLGLLGAIVYVIFNLIGEWTEKVLSQDDPTEAYLRLLLGPLVGWVFFFAFVQETFKKPDGSSALLLFPFLAGFSTKLVVGIINQTIQAVQMTLGLEDKTSRLLARKSREKLREKPG
jgi:hypothetical protein